MSDKIGQQVNAGRDMVKAFISDPQFAGLLTKREQEKVEALAAYLMHESLLMAGNETPMGKFRLLVLASVGTAITFGKGRLA